MPTIRLFVLAAAAALSGCAAATTAADPAAPAAFDVLLRGGTVVDGTGAPRYRADIGVRDGRIAAVGALAGARATLVLDVTGLFVAPGFINLHSHANAAGLPTAENMLTQGVTTELLNADGGGPIDVAAQLAALEAAGLAVNVGAYAGFNTVWARVVGPDDRRPAADEIAVMSGLIVDNLRRGAWGVSAGLDYKPAYFAAEAEVVDVLRPAAAWRTHFTNHDRVAPETNYSSLAGMLETMRIGEAAGLVPVITHMKVQGHEQGTADVILGHMAAATARGVYTAADVYPYLAGQTSLAALLIPGWAQEGGRQEMLRRFADPALRARIAAEAEEAMDARFGGAAGVYLPATRRELVDVMREQGVESAGEAVVRLLEAGSPGAILRFGSEADLVRIMRHPTTSIACDCGASRSASHPRGFGTYPRVLGRYVREQQVLTWEDAVRRMTALPAATIGLTDRGRIAPGMAADIVVFDTATVIDHATFAEPTLLSDGIIHVLVNGVAALRDGRATGEQGGRALHRSAWLPSRPLDAQRASAVTVRGSIVGDAGATIQLDIAHDAATGRPTGTVRVTAARTGVNLTATSLGALQTADGWAAVTGMARLEPGGAERAFTIYVDQADPFADGAATVTVVIDGLDAIRGVLRDGTAEIRR